MDNAGIDRKDWIELQNLSIRGGSESLLKVPYGSLSTLTGLSGGSRVVRPCQVVRTVTNSSRRTRSPSVLLESSYDWMSSEDQKILNLMLMRREAQIEEQEILLSARKLWEKDRITSNKLKNERRKMWNEMVAERRRQEKFEMERRKESEIAEEQRQILELERRINERHSRCEQRQFQISKHMKAPKDEVDADARYHRMRRERLDQEEATRAALHLNEVLEKELQVHDNLNAILMSRKRSLNERRLKREKKMQAAQEIRKALKSEWDEWCSETARVLANRLCMSEFRSGKVVDWKRKVAREKNQMKRQQHAQTMMLLNEEDKLQEFRARQELLQKETRIKTTLARKEEMKRRSRNNAMAAANLRHKIKAAYQLS